MSSLGWVDFSSEDRTRVQEVLALLKQPGTLDELGIGQVRDAFSDLLFPGFSTIQTRARYFLAVPKSCSIGQGSLQRNVASNHLLRICAIQRMT